MTDQAKTRDFRAFSRMGSDALLFMTVQFVVNTLWRFWPLFIVIVVKSRTITKMVLFISGFVVLIVLASVLMKVVDYLNRYFKIEDQKLVYKRGFFDKQVKILPLERIHTIRTKSGFWYQMFDMVGVSFDSIASEDVEVELLLNKEDFGLLLKTINEEGDYVISVAEGGEGEAPKEVLHPSDYKKFDYSIKDLVLGAVTQNPIKGLLLFFGVVSFLFGEFYEVLLDHLSEVVDTVHYWYLGSDWVVLTLVFVVSYLFTLLVWIIYAVVRQYGATVSVTSDKIRYEAGLLTRRAAFIAKTKITALTVKINILERLFGISTLRIEQSDAVEGKEGKERIIIFGWKYYDALINEWYGAEAVTRVERIRSGIGLFVYTFFVWGIFVVALPTTVLMWYYPQALWLVLPATLGITALGAFLRYRQSGIALDRTHLLIYDGQYALRRTFIPIENVESVAVAQSFIQKRSGRAQLIIHTMADVHSVRSISHPEACKIRDYVLYKLEKGASA